MPDTSALKELPSPALHSIYDRVDELKSEEITCADKGVTGAGITRMRVLLSTLTKLCKAARKELHEVKNGKVRSPGRDLHPNPEEGESDP